MKAVILAGGMGKRLLPITMDIPKPMVPVLNNPLIDYTVRMLHKSDIYDIGVALNYLPEVIIAFLTERYGAGSFKFSIESEPCGTAGCCKRMADFLDQTFVVVSGDALTDIDLQKMYERHVATCSLVTIAAKVVNDPSNFGVIKADKSGTVYDFEEKPVPGKYKSALVSCGVYIIEPSVLSLVPADCFYDFAHDLFPVLLAKGIRMSVYDNVHYWSDIGTPEALHAANMDSLNRAVNFKAFMGGFEDIMEAAESRIGSNTKSVVLHKSVEKSKECAVFPNSVIGANVEINAYSVVANAVVFGGAVLSSSAMNCVCGKFGCLPINVENSPVHQKTAVLSYNHLSK